MDLFESKNIKPMLIGETRDAFNSPDYIYELKLDGVRCIAYLDNITTELRNKRNIKVTKIYPELSNIHKQVKHRCILDGELIVTKDGKPDFYEVQRRALMSNSFKIKLAASKLPVSFTAFDILYYNDHQVMDLPLMQRKELLQKVINENEQISISRYIEEQGIDFYNLAVQNKLEGIVAKKKDSKYYLDQRTTDWIKSKYLMSVDFVVCGYILKNKGVASIVLGKYSDKQLVYEGHVILGTSTAAFKIVKEVPKLREHLFNVMPAGNEDAVWIKPILVCIVEYMYTPENALRQPIFKSLRDDKSPKDCTV